MGLLVSGVCLAVHNDLNVNDVKVALTARKRWVWLSVRTRVRGRRKTCLWLMQKSSFNIIIH